jgi:hypothetical protein
MPYHVGCGTTGGCGWLLKKGVVLMDLRKTACTGGRGLLTRGGCPQLVVPRAGTPAREVQRLG